MNARIIQTAFAATMLRLIAFKSIRCQHVVYPWYTAWQANHLHRPNKVPVTVNPDRGNLEPYDIPTNTIRHIVPHISVSSISQSHTPHTLVPRILDHARFLTSRPWCTQHQQPAGVPRGNDHYVCPNTPKHRGVGLNDSYIIPRDNITDAVDTRGLFY